MTVESQERAVFHQCETRPAPTLDDLPHEIILEISKALLTKPRRKNGSGVCNWIRTSTRYAEILVPMLYMNAFLPVKITGNHHEGQLYGEKMISTPPHGMWRCARNWQSDYVLGLFSTLDLDWISKIKFYVERGARGRFTNVNIDDMELMINKVARSGNVKLVRLLLAKGVSPNEGVPLLPAIKEGHFEVIQVLLDAGAAISYREPPYQEMLNVPLCSAIALHSHNRNKYIALFLIEKIRSSGGSFEYPGNLSWSEFSRTPLYHAVEQSSIDIVRLLLEYGADPFTALNPAARGHTACHSQRTEGNHTEHDISLMLINKMEEKDHDRLLGLSDNIGNTPLHNAIVFQEWPLVRRCIELGFDVSGAKNLWGGDNALHLAIRHDAPKSVIDLILAKGPESWDEPGNTKFQDLFWSLVEKSSFLGLVALAELRENHKISFDPSELKQGANALHRVIAHSKIGKDTNRKAPKIIQLLLNLGVTPNLQDGEHQRTPLLALLRRKHIHLLPNFVELLIQNMSNSALAAQDNEGFTCLHIACRYADVATVSLLLPKMEPASILLLNHKVYGNTALHCILEPLRVKYQSEECSEILRLLIQYNPEIIHIRDLRGNTPLHMFSLWSETIQDIMNLCEAGADLSALNGNGEPPFHMTSSARLPDITQLLLDSGADMHENCKACRTDLADFRGREKVSVVASGVVEPNSVIEDNVSLGLSDVPSLKSCDITGAISLGANSVQMG